MTEKERLEKIKKYEELKLKNLELEKKHKRVNALYHNKIVQEYLSLVSCYKNKVKTQNELLYQSFNMMYYSKCQHDIYYDDGWYEKEYSYEKNCDKKCYKEKADYKKYICLDCGQVEHIKKELVDNFENKHIVIHTDKSIYNIRMEYYKLLFKNDAESCIKKYKKNYSLKK